MISKEIPLYALRRRRTKKGFTLTQIKDISALEFAPGKLVLIRYDRGTCQAFMDDEIGGELGLNRQAIIEGDFTVCESTTTN